MKWLAAAAATLILFAVCVVSWLSPYSPPRTEQITLPQEAALGVWTGRAYTYVLPTAHGAVLVDTGSRNDGFAIDAALSALHRQPADVSAILLTCGHADQRAAAGHYPNATVYVGPLDEPLARNKQTSKALAPRLLSWWLGHPAPPLRLAAVLPGSLLHLDGLEVSVIALPGHTPGSLAFVARGVAFVGDNAHSESATLRTWLAGLSDVDARASRRSLERLVDAHPTFLANAHFGWGPWTANTPQ